MAAVDPSTFTQLGVPQHLCGGLMRYVDWHVRPGSFLQAMIAHDTEDAASRADPDSKRGMDAVAKWLQQNAPAECQGSRDAIEKWVKQGLPKT